MSQTRCAVCGEGPLQEIAGFDRLARVTSDCKPWPAGGKLHCCAQCGAVQKPADDRWHAEIRQIYGAYDIYHLSSGSEQVIFANGSDAAPRSHALVDYVVKAAGLPARGRLIDVGCGNGAALANFSRALPDWRLYGSELSDKALPRLRQLPNFETLFTTDVGDIPGQFDVVSMINSLEHMPQPYETLTAAARRLTAAGTLFIEVPDLESSPFDLAVADHRMHFTQATLGHLAARAGMSALTLTNQVLPKELTFLGRQARPDGRQRPAPQAGRTLVEATVRWLVAVQRAAEQAAAAPNFGIFGTSIAGMWLYGPLRARVGFFVDEDATRIGRSFEGRPILSPAQVPAGSTVFVALAPAIARKVVVRLAGQPARFVAPPEFAL